MDIMLLYHLVAGQFQKLTKRDSYQIVLVEPKLMIMSNLRVDENLLFLVFVNTENKYNSSFEMIEAMITESNLFNTFNKIVNTFNNTVAQIIFKTNVI